MSVEYTVIRSDEHHIGRFDIVCETIEKDGHVFPFSYIKMKRCVGILCRVGDYFVLQEQYRHTLGTWELEIPAGTVETDENPKDAAIREVGEELGYVVDNISFLGEYHLSVGSSDEMVFLYYAECTNNTGQRLDALELIKPRLIHKCDMEDVIMSDMFRQSLGIVAWIKYRNNMGWDIL